MPEVIDVGRVQFQILIHEMLVLILEFHFSCVSCCLFFSIMKRNVLDYITVVVPTTDCVKTSVAHILPATVPGFDQQSFLDLIVFLVAVLSCAGILVQHLTQKLIAKVHKTVLDQFDLILGIFLIHVEYYTGILNLS